MNDFKSYLLETQVLQTKRTNMIHFQDMKPLEFIQFMKEIRTTMDGKLHNLKTVMKIDGLGARFGKSEDGRIFFEGSRTGPVFDDKSFSNYARAKGSKGEIIARAEHYDDILQVFKTAGFMKVVPPDRKVICEVFYNPMAEESETGVTFVTIEYDKKALGSLMSIMPYQVVVASTGETARDEASIIKALYNQSTAEIRIIDPQLSMGLVDINTFIDPITALGPKSIEALGSRKAEDKPLKDNVIQVVNKVKDALAEYLLDHPEIVGKFRLGPNIEGIVLHIHGKTYKITTPEFKDAIRAKREAYNAT